MPWLGILMAFFCNSGNVALSVLMTAASTLSAVVGNSSCCFNIVFFFLIFLNLISMDTLTVPFENQRNK